MKSSYYVILFSNCHIHLTSMIVYAKVFGVRLNIDRFE
jgi:hypothetical protein